MSGLAEDEARMRHALLLAERNLGAVAPNPAVGCIIVDADRRIVGRGWTARGGRPHAETVALDQAGASARGATAYVTLEPCAHHGQTPPCADAMIAAGIARVVAATHDPDPRVSGKGFDRLAAAGVEVVRGACEAEARALNAGFFSRVEKGRPLVTLKIAETSDGFAAVPGAKWITSEAARRHGHYLRATHDAIMVGIGTVLADDPLLNCRLEGMEDRSPLRIVVDSGLRLPLSSQLARSARQIPVLVLTAVAKDSGDLREAGVEVVTLDKTPDGKVDLTAATRLLAKRDLTRLLVEGGPELQRAMLTAGLADRLYLYRAPQRPGAGLRSASDALPPGVHMIERVLLGPDLLESYALPS
jgi:diaminohydroxyphosphoribosylaminopyrimidine deaminase/5-amino-6-(5-phosphoribosylamino)uracil reductase